MAQASAHVSLPLLRPIPLDGLGAGGAIPVPVARVIGAPLPGGASAGTPRPGTPSVPDEIVMARTAVGRKDNTSAPSSQVNSPLHGKLTWKRAASPNPWPRDHPIDRLSDH